MVDTCSRPPLLSASQGGAPVVRLPPPPTAHRGSRTGRFLPGLPCEAPGPPLAGLSSGPQGGGAPCPPPPMVTAAWVRWAGEERGGLSLGRAQWLVSGALHVAEWHLPLKVTFRTGFLN